jgi:hypothetical protein
MHVKKGGVPMAELLDKQLDTGGGGDNYQPPRPTDFEGPDDPGWEEVIAEQARRDRIARQYFINNVG